MKPGTPITSPRRAKVYFLIITLAMVMAVFFYGWNFSERVNSYTVHKSKATQTGDFTVQRVFNVNEYTGINATSKGTSNNVTQYRNDTRIFTSSIENRKTFPKGEATLTVKLDNHDERKGHPIEVVRTSTKNHSKMHLQSFSHRNTSAADKESYKDVKERNQPANFDTGKTLTKTHQRKKGNRIKVSNQTSIIEKKLVDITTEKLFVSYKDKTINTSFSHASHMHRQQNDTILVSTLMTTITTFDEPLAHRLNVTKSPESQIASLKKTLFSDALSNNSKEVESVISEFNSSSNTTSSATTTLSFTTKQHRGTNQRLADLREERLNYAKLRNERLQNKLSDQRRFETVNLKHKTPVHTFNVVDPLKYGMWNPVDTNRASRGPRVDQSTVRPEMCQGCFKTDFKEIISAPNVCQSGTNVSVLILIASAPRNREARAVIRTTWGKVCNDPKSAIRCVFVFGQHSDETVNSALVSESEQYLDIVQFAFHDSYANLTYKTMMSMKWASINCQQANYVMKTDDDMFVNTELLPLFLQGAPDTRLFGGFCWGPSAPHRDMSSKWYVSYEQFSQPLYPTMCSGTGYVMTRDVMLDVLKQSTDVPFFYLEDVYVSLCLNKQGIKPKSLSGFNNMKTAYEACTFRNRVITSHEHPPDELKYIWSDMQSCPREQLTPRNIFFSKHIR